MSRAASAPVKMEEEVADLDGMIDFCAFVESTPSVGATGLGQVVKDEFPRAVQIAASTSTVAKEVSPDGPDETYDFFDDLFGDAEGSAEDKTLALSPPPAVEDRCRLCGSTPNDIDLSDRRAERKVPFMRTRVSTVSQLDCDYCAGMMRYQMEAGKGMKEFMDSVKGSTEAHTQYLRQLACYLALRKIESQQHVRKVKLDKLVALVGAVNEIYDVLYARNYERSGPGASSESGSRPGLVGGNGHVLGLRDYIACHGNPLANGDVVLPATIADSCCLIVSTLRPPTQSAGRHSLRSVIEHAIAGHPSAPPVLRSLAECSVDDMETLRLVRHVATEFVSREQLRREIIGSLAPTSKGGSDVTPVADSARSVRAGFCPGSVANDPSDRSERSNVADSADVAKTLSFDDADADADAASESARSLGSASRASFSVPPVESTAPAPRTARRPSGGSGGLGVARDAPREGALKWLSDFERRGDKGLDKLAKSIFASCKLFTVLGWRRSLRGKEKAASNLVQKVAAEISACQANRREDKIPSLEALQAVAQSCVILIHEGKAKAVLDMEVDTVTDLVSHVVQFLQWAADRFGGEVLQVDNHLLQVQAVLGLSACCFSELCYVRKTRVCIALVGRLLPLCLSIAWLKYRSVPFELPWAMGFECLCLYLRQIARSLAPSAVRPATRRSWACRSRSCASRIA